MSVGLAISGIVSAGLIIGFAVMFVQDQIDSALAEGYIAGYNAGYQDCKKEMNGAAPLD